MYINGLAHACSNSSALALELLQSSTKPSIWTYKNYLLHPGKKYMLEHSLEIAFETFPKWKILQPQKHKRITHFCNLQQNKRHYCSCLSWEFYTYLYR